MGDHEEHEWCQQLVRDLGFTKGFDGPLRCSCWPVLSRRAPGLTHMDGKLMGYVGAEPRTLWHIGWGLHGARGLPHRWCQVVS